MTHELTDEAKQFALYITDERRAMSVGLRYDGSVEFRGCSPDEASRLFWDNMGKEMLVRAAELAHLAQRGTSEAQPNPQAWIQELVLAWNEAYPRMDIYAKPGTLVMFDARGGYESEQENAKKVLQMRGLYEVEYTEVGGSSTAVKLRGVDRRFNSVLFAAPPAASPQAQRGTSELPYPEACDVQRVLGYLRTDETQIRAAKVNAAWADTMARATDLIRQLAAYPEAVQPPAAGVPASGDRPPAVGDDIAAIRAARIAGVDVPRVSNNKPVTGA